MSERLSGILGWVGIALVLGALVVRFALPEQQEVWYWSAVAGIAVVGLYILTQWRDIFGAFGPRRAKYGALATSSVTSTRNWQRTWRWRKRRRVLASTHTSW